MIERLPDPVRSRAVLIGTSTYRDPDFAALPGVENNLTDLRTVLTEPWGTGLHPEHCVVSLNPPAQGDVGEQIVRAAQEAEDVLLVYYAGHGEMTWDQPNELCLTMRDTKSTSLRTSALRCADLRQYIRKSGASTRVLILDCCFGGTTLSDTMSGSNTVLSEVNVAGAYVLAATYGRALAPKKQRNTLFTGELLRVLTEGIAAEQGMLLSLDALFREITANMHRQGLPEPCSNHSDTAASLALAPNAAHQVRTLLDDLRARVQDLGEAEDRTTLAYDTTNDRIAAPNLPPFTAAAPVLLDRVDALDRRAMAGQPPAAAELDGIEAELADARDAAERLRELAAGPLDWRNELRGRLDSYRAMAVRLCVAEEAELSAQYTAARALLWVKPCDLRAATTAVSAFKQAVVEWREKGR